MRNLKILTLASLMAIAACGKHNIPAKGDQGNGLTPAPAPDTNLSKDDKNNNNKKTVDNKVVAPKDFLSIGGKSPAATLFEGLSKLDGKTDVADVALPLMAKKFQAEFTDQVVLTVVETLGDADKLHLDSLMGDSKLFSTSITSNTKAEKLTKKSVAADYKLMLGDQAVTFDDKAAPKTAAPISGVSVKLDKGTENAYTGALPVLQVDVAKITNLVLDLSKDPIAAPIAIKSDGKAADGKAPDCFIVAKNEVVPAGIILSNIIAINSNDKSQTIDFSKLDKADLGKIPPGEMAAYFVCGSVEAKDDSTFSAILFAQKPMKLTIKAAAQAAAATEKKPDAAKQ